MRDIQVPPVVFVGCIGPVFLCLLAIGLGYIYLNLPMWLHGPELQAALERYDRVVVSIFRAEQPSSALEDIAIDPHLGWLIDELSGKQNKFYGKDTDPEFMEITRIREYTDYCAVVILDQYYNFQDVAFVLGKVDESWKIQRIVPSHNAGVFGLLSLRTC